MTESAVDFETVDQAEPGMFFPGDSGEFGLHLRTAIVRLVKGPFLSAEDHEQAYSALLRNEDIVRKHLSEMFLILVIDHDASIAFARQAVSEQQYPVLLRRTPLNLVESAVIVSLRQSLGAVLGTDRYAVVSLEELQDEILSFRRFSDTNESSIRNSVEAAANKMLKYGVLKRVRDTDNRFTVMPLLRVLFTVEEISALLTALRTVADATAEEDAQTDEGDIDE